MSCVPETIVDPEKRNYFKSILERNADAECKNNLICLPFFLSLRLLIGILGQAFLAVLKISGYIGEKTNSRKRKGGS